MGFGGNVLAGWAVAAANMGGYQSQTAAQRLLKIPPSGAKNNDSVFPPPVLGGGQKGVVVTMWAAMINLSKPTIFPPHIGLKQG